MVKNWPANAGDLRDTGSIPGLRRSPGEGHGNPLQYSCLRSPIDRGAWQATVHGVAKSWILLKQDSMHVHVQDCTVGAFQTWDWDPGSLASKSVLFRKNFHPEGIWSLRVRAKSLQLNPTLCFPVDHSPPGSSVHGIFQARMLERVPMPSSRGSS